MTLVRALEVLCLVALLLAFVPLAAADEPQPALAPAAADAETDADAAEGEERPAITERMTITATRVQTKVENAPAPLTVLTSEEIADSGASSYSDILRRVPGVNVVQFSARDINITTRGATASLSPGQLVLVDNRTIYQDFFGFVMWDFLPVDYSQIKQVEAVRGPGSAVWGANALNGVVNILTKGPDDLHGGSLTFGVGEYSTRYASATWGETFGDFGVRLSGSYYEQGAYDRPEGTILPSGVFLPVFDDPGTEQPKLDALVEYDMGNAGEIAFSLGSAETAGIINTGIGPFDIDPDTSLSYFKGEWTKGGYRLTFFINDLDGDGLNLLNGIDFLFKTTTYNLDFVGSNVLSDSFRLVYGVNARTNDFDLSIAPREDKRDEFGVFGQAEFILGKWRLTAGGRVDRYPDTIGTAVSPRAAVIFEVAEGQNLRLSFSQAYRAPSLVNNFLETQIDTTVDVGPLCDALGPGRVLVPDCAAVPPGTPVAFTFSTDAVGNEDLEEESITAFDLGYIGTWRNFMFTVSLYQNDTEDIIDFFPSTFYSESAGNVPSGWPFPSPPFPPFLDILASGGSGLPSEFTYRNIAKIRDRGIEVTADWRVTEDWDLYFNWARQDDPKITQTEGDEEFGVNLPPHNRFGLGINHRGDRVSWGLNATYTGRAFWSDVLDSRFWGETDPYLLLNGRVSVNLIPERLALVVKGSNLTDELVQQHIFGDFIGRRIITELRYTF